MSWEDQIGIINFSNDLTVYIYRNLEAIRLVIDKYNKQLKKRLEGTGKNPSYMAWVDDDCNVSVKSGTHQPGKWTVNQSFDVDVCKGEAKRWRWSRKEGKVYDNDLYR